MKQCSNCEHFNPQAIQSTPADKTGKGFCRRYPPQISDRMVEKYFVQGMRGCELGLLAAWWPAVDKEMGCGEHSVKKVKRGKTK